MRIKIFPLIRIIYNSKGLQIACLVLEGAVFLVTWGMSERLKVDHWAAWVQAVGSIIALGVAIFVMSRQNAHATRLMVAADRTATARRVRSTYALVKRTQQAFNDAYFYATLPMGPVANIQGAVLHFKTNQSIAEDIVASLRQVPTYDIGSYEMADAIHTLTEMMDANRVVCASLVINPFAAGTTFIVNGHKNLRRVLDAAVLSYEVSMNAL